MVVAVALTYARSAYDHNVVSSKPAHGEVYSMHHYVIKFVTATTQ